MEITVRKYTVKSTVHGKYGKYSTSLLMLKQTDLHDGARPDLHVTTL